MAEKIEVWKTKDGKQFNTESEANDHEFYLRWRESYNENPLTLMYIDSYDKEQTEIVDFDEVLKWLKVNREIILKILD